MSATGTMTLAWGTGANAQSYTVNILKASIKEVYGRIGSEGGSETKTFTVMIQFAVGTHIG